MAALNDFVKEELYPSLFNKVDEAFPWMHFQRYRGGWRSAYKLNGEPSHDGRIEKSKVTTKVPHRVLEQGGDSKDLVAFYQERHNLPKPIDAIKELASICGLTLPPMGDEEGYRLQVERQNRLEQMSSRMEEALYTDEGADTLSYLREVRGYSDEVIRGCSFGYLAPSMIEELRELFQGGTTFPSHLENFPLSITYRTGGAVKGFIFRSLNPNTADKYRDLYTTERESKKYTLFGLTGLKLTGDKKRDRDITIMEGQIDALRASFAGVPNIVAASGGVVSEEAIIEAKKKGVKRVTILFDTDGHKEATEEIFSYSKVKEAISTINRQGLRAYVCHFPNEGRKMDADTYLQNHNGEELNKIIEEAISAPLWLYARLEEKFIAEAPEEGYIRDGKQVEDFTDEVLALCYSPHTSDLDRDSISKDYERITGKSLAEAISRFEDKQAKIKQKTEAVELFKTALDLATSGKEEEALSMAESRLPSISQISSEAEYVRDLTPRSEEGILKGWRERPTGIKTPYNFKGKKFNFPLMLPSGALTLICGQTSHGKSRFLENLALFTAQNGDEGKVFYFSYEEDSVSVEIQLLNIFANIEITSYGNNLNTLNEYYGEGSTKYFKSEVFKDFKEKEREFLALLTSGKLNVFSKYNDINKLAAAIRSYNRNTKVKAVFVDYIQLMREQGRSSSRKDELRDVCEILKDVSKETGLPIVLAAQLNRATPSPIDMTSQNIADAADIEHSANVVVLLWNSAVKPKSKDNNTFYIDRVKETLSPEAEKLKERGFIAGQGGKLYAVLDKNRGAERFIDAVLDFDQNTGFIKPNPQDAPKEIKPEQSKLDFNEEQGYKSSF